MDATFPARVGRLRARQGNHPVEALLLNGKIAFCAPHQTAHPGANETYLAVLATGERAFFKPFSGVNVTLAHVYGQDDAAPLHECLAWQLARALGSPHDQLVPPCVLRDAGVGPARAPSASA